MPIEIVFYILFLIGIAIIIRFIEWSQHRKLPWTRVMRAGEFCTICGCTTKAYWESDYNNTYELKYDPYSGIAIQRQDEWIKCSKNFNHPKQMTGHSKKVEVRNDEC